jgi:hypothetical protein
MRKNFIPRLGRLQLDLGNGVREYNEREHSGKHCFGKTPLQTFLDAAHLAQEKMLDRLTFGNASDTLGLRAAPERGLHPGECRHGPPHRRATMVSVRRSLGRNIYSQQAMASNHYCESIL